MSYRIRFIMDVVIPDGVIRKGWTATKLYGTFNNILIDEKYRKYLQVPWSDMMMLYGAAWFEGTYKRIKG